MLYQMQRLPWFCATTTSLIGTHWVRAGEGGRERGEGEGGEGGEGGGGEGGEGGLTQ